MRCSVSNCGNCDTDRILLFSASHIRLMVTIHPREAEEVREGGEVSGGRSGQIDGGGGDCGGRVGGGEGNEVGE